jgi:hypothetical protein
MRRYTVTGEALEDDVSLSDVDYISTVTATVTLEMIHSFQKTSLLYQARTGCNHGADDSINYVGHGGTYDQQDEIDGVKTIEFSTTLQDFLDHLDVTLSKVFGQAIYYWKG